MRCWCVGASKAGDAVNGRRFRAWLGTETALERGANACTYAYLVGTTNLVRSRDSNGVATDEDRRVVMIVWLTKKPKQSFF